MTIVIAHAGDPVARQLVVDWTPEARLITPRDLSRPGWRHFPVGGGDDTFALEDHAMRANEASAVFVRIAAVLPTDLAHIAEEDRAYVAAEMTAFLASFLSSLRCPVVNRPSASSLMGPGWSCERWRAAAIAAGLDIAAPDSGDLVTVVGGDCIGAGNERVADRALTLARFAGVDFLPLRMTVDARFAGAEPWAALPPAAAAALRALLAAHAECAS